MFSLHTFASLAMQLARLVPDPSADSHAKPNAHPWGRLGAAAHAPVATSSCGSSSRRPISRPRARDVVSRSTSWRPSGLREDGQTVVGIGLGRL